LVGQLCSIHSGVINGLVHEIDGFIDEYQGLASKFIIILTGGDTEFLAKRLKIPYLPIQIFFRV
jgi:type III pantothenate kinase